METKDNVIDINEVNPANMTDKDHAELLLKTMINLNHYIAEFCRHLPVKLSQDMELTDKIRAHLFSEDIFNNLNPTQKMKLYQITLDNLDCRVRLLLDLHKTLPDSVNQLDIIKKLKSDIASMALHKDKDIDPEKANMIKKMLLDEINRRMIKERKDNK